MSQRQQASPAVHLAEGTAIGKPAFSRRVEEEKRNYGARFSSERKPPMALKVFSANKLLNVF